MTDLVNKLLLLSQAEAWNASAPGTGHVVTDLVPAVTAVLEDLVVLAQRKQIDLWRRHARRMHPGTHQRMDARRSDFQSGRQRHPLHP
jgi:hypothetical protein